MVARVAGRRWQTIVLERLVATMPKSLYEGGKHRRHFTLSDHAYAHLSSIAAEAQLSRSEALERLIRSVPQWEGIASLADDAWSMVIDYSLPENHETF